MKKYWHVIGIGIQNNLTYRFNYLTRTLFSFIPLFAMLSLWRTIYTANGDGRPLSGYTEAQMIFYYIMVAIVDIFTGPLKGAVHDHQTEWPAIWPVWTGSPASIEPLKLEPLTVIWHKLVEMAMRLAKLSLGGGRTTG